MTSETAEPFQKTASEEKNYTSSVALYFFPVRFVQRNWYIFLTGIKIRRPEKIQRPFFLSRFTSEFIFDYISYFSIKLVLNIMQ